MKTQILDANVRSFLLHETRTGKLATVCADGRPHVVPVWYHVDGGDIIFMTGDKTVKAKNMRRDGRVSMCVDDENAPYAYAQVEGTVSFSEDPQELLHWATVIGGRYMGQDRAEEYGKRNGVPGELVVRLHPTQILFEENIAGY
ncbi:PPOX class F420-dependent enzyme [Ktedonobacter sp. SOSP1-85]|uniref:PPOX class F420-dependent oxidoreductase n=1 Tax=Ktedonobacter sp. SOSP1-85 TaxID=2778367 RepID=UPI00191675D5|nr:PPOX class F420-dependent oxidoreductase [Ktedonobacter sp. SOSP1-85]GHO74182.1 PPOX class F420-dependent enzyme [Ktedonobacter sp. SOSP1-85]